MSRILNELIENKISLSECLQRLLVIATKTKNSELSEWCESELNGYKKYEQTPDYRRFKNRCIFYSGINGRFQIKNNPIQPGYLSEKTLQQIEKVAIFDGVTIIEKCKDSKENKAKDLTVLSSEVLKNTMDEYTGIGVMCTSIQQVFPNEFLRRYIPK